MKITIENIEIYFDKREFIDLNSGRKGSFESIPGLSSYIFLSSSENFNSMRQIIRIKKPYCVIVPKGDRRGRKNSNGYPSCRLTDDNGVRLSGGSCRVNTLMWRAFYGEIPKKEGKPLEVDHDDENVWNNDIDKLKLTPHSINVRNHVRTAALDYVKENNIPIPTNKIKPKPIQQAVLFCFFFILISTISYNSPETSNFTIQMDSEPAIFMENSQVFFGLSLSKTILRHETYGIPGRVNIRQPEKPEAERHSIEAKGVLYEFIAQGFYR